MCVNRARRDLEVGYQVQSLPEAQEQEGWAQSHIDDLWQKLELLIARSEFILSLIFPTLSFYLRSSLPAPAQPGPEHPPSGQLPHPIAVTHCLGLMCEEVSPGPRLVPPTPASVLCNQPFPF